MQTQRYTVDAVPDLVGKTILVTGANSGVGFAAAKIFAEKGARVVLGVRSEAKGQRTIERIGETVRNAKLRFVILHLDDLRHVREATQSLQPDDPVDVLVNNAGVMTRELTRTQDGYEAHFGVNHLGHFALSGLLLPSLAENARIVTVASSAHYFAKIDFADLHARRHFKARQRYAMSKLANLLFSQELHRRLQASGSRKSALACHPGGADTNLFRHIPRTVYRLVRPLAKLVVNDAEEGALPIVRAATDVAAQSGEYFGPAGWLEIAHSAKRVAMSGKAHDTALAKQLWETSIKLTGVDPGV